MNFLNNLLLKGQLFLAKAPAGGAANPIDKVTEATNGVASSLTKLGLAVSVIMMIVAGIAWMLGAGGSHFGKKILEGIVIGAVLIALASTVVPWIISIFA